MNFLTQLIGIFTPDFPSKEAEESTGMVGFRATSIFCIV